MKNFDYQEAFSRNIGLLTEAEQNQLRKFTIALPGMGGVGGSHLIALARQGFERFKIADFDTFELKNFNRQYGARLDTIGREKAKVMAEEVLKINPNCQVETFLKGINNKNLDRFLAGVDLVVDGLDAFAIDDRRSLFMRARQLNIPVITAAPIGFGCAFLIFMPDGPSFDDFFRQRPLVTKYERLLAFMVGLVPALLQRSYMSGIDLKRERGPSSVSATYISTGIAVALAVKILLRKGRVKSVPYFHQFDMMKGKYVCGRLWFGNYHPIQRLKYALADQLIKHD